MQPARTRTPTRVAEMARLRRERRPLLEFYNRPVTISGPYAGALAVGGVLEKVETNSVKPRSVASRSAVIVGSTLLAGLVLVSTALTGGACFGLLANDAQAAPPVLRKRVDPKVNLAHRIQQLSEEPVRGMTIGPIENQLHPNLGYGSSSFEATLDRVRALGSNWISLTVFGRVWDLDSTQIDPRFEVPLQQNEAALRRAIAQAHARGLRVMLVPHLWVESGGWRGELHPDADKGWERFRSAYIQFVSLWAKLAENSEVDLFSVGVELRSWVATPRAASFSDVIRAVRDVYHGPITYAGNWDDVEQIPILNQLDVIGINAFYPLHDKENASFPELLAGGLRVKERVHNLAVAWNKPVLFTEMGYTNRSDPAIRPWEWPDHMQHVTLAPEAQAEAFAALLSGVLAEPLFAGFFVWRTYADSFDCSQEAEWGFSPLYRAAELVLRDAYRTRWHTEGFPHSPLFHRREEGIGAF